MGSERLYALYARKCYALKGARETRGKPMIT